MIEFNLPEDKDDLEMAQMAPKYFSVIYNFNEWIRREIGRREFKLDEGDAYHEIRQKFLELLDDEGIII